ncbi:hypothetical protein VTH06DRAFT_998 [Thermothelomyces fergusii]
MWPAPRGRPPAASAAVQGDGIFKVDFPPPALPPGLQQLKGKQPVAVDSSTRTEQQNRPAVSSRPPQHPAEEPAKQEGRGVRMR